MSFKSLDWLGHQPEQLLPRLRSLIADLEAISSSGHYVPPKKTVAIDDWLLMRRAVPCLAGRPTGHPDIKNGSPAVTSEIYFIDHKRRLARSLSRWYRLDEPFSIGDN